MEEEVEQVELTTEVVLNRAMWRGGARRIAEGLGNFANFVKGIKPDKNRIPTTTFNFFGKPSIGDTFRDCPRVTLFEAVPGFMNYCSAIGVTDIVYSGWLSLILTCLL